MEDVTVVIPATGEHTYGDPVFTWTKDHAACTAAFTCAVCKDEVTENATVTSAVTKAASCKEEGVTTYTADRNICRKNLYRYSNRRDCKNRTYLCEKDRS